MQQCLDELKNCTYDLRGNLITQGSTQYTYDALNRLIGVITPLKETHYKYDPLDRLIFKDDEQFIWDDFQEIGSTRALRIINPVTFKALLIEMDKQSFIPIYDACNHLRLLTNKSTGQTEQFDYTPFGLPLGESECSWAFASTRFDPDTNLYYHLHRFYDPTLKRWLTLDPAGFVDGTNLYAYLKNNPNRYYDPTGQFIFLIPLLIFGADACAFVGISTALGALIDCACYAALATACYQVDIALNNNRSAHYSYSSSSKSKCEEQKTGDNEEEQKKNRNPVWPETAEEMDKFLDLPGVKIADSPSTPGRNKTVWQPNDGTKITGEQHPYHPNAPEWHRGPHWHLDLPEKTHQRYLPGDPIPGY